MAFTESEAAEYTDVLNAFIEQVRPPEHIREKLDYSYGLDASKQAVELIEIRPSFQNPKKKTRRAFARARYVRNTAEWRIYWMRSDLKWHAYVPMSSVSNLLAFLAVVREDAYGCFYG